MVEWKNPVQMVVSTLGSDPESGACVLEYLKVLPEEVTEGRRINLTVRETIASEFLVWPLQQPHMILILPIRTNS